MLSWHYCLMKQGVDKGLKLNMNKLNKLLNLNLGMHKKNKMIFENV
jgi:hypothetical protein